jgi:hypothetical protein
MPSDALQAFRYNIVDVDRLIESHGRLHDGNPGKKGLGHITRSGVVMLCAAWELYLESLVVEGAKYLTKQCQSPDQLPDRVQKELSKVARESKHELKPLEFAGDGWKRVLVTHAEELCRGINTPKAGPINELFARVLGLENLSDCWSCGKDAINTFVSARGDIAHRGRYADYIKIGQLAEYRTRVDTTTVETDNMVGTHLAAITPSGHKPWKATT